MHALGSWCGAVSERNRSETERSLQPLDKNPLRAPTIFCTLRSSLAPRSAPLTCSAIEVLLACLQEAKSWLEHKCLALNENKTEIVLFGPSDFYDLGGLDDLSSYVSPCVKNLGVLFDSGLKFDKQIHYVVNHVFIIDDISQKLNLFFL